MFVSMIKSLNRVSLVYKHTNSSLLNSHLNQIAPATQVITRGMKGSKIAKPTRTTEPSPFEGAERPMQLMKKLISEIDTTLTSEQQLKVDALKTKYLKGSSGKYSPYRDVPSPDEIEKVPRYVCMYM